MLVIILPYLNHILMNSVIIEFTGSWSVAAVEDGYPQCPNAPASIHLGTTFQLTSRICQDCTTSDQQGLLRKYSTKMLIKVKNVLVSLFWWHAIECGLPCCQRVMRPLWKVLYQMDERLPLYQSLSKPWPGPKMVRNLFLWLCLMVKKVSSDPEAWEWECLILITGLLCFRTYFPLPPSTACRTLGQRGPQDAVLCEAATPTLLWVPTVPYPQFHTPMGP